MRDSLKRRKRVSEDSEERRLPLEKNDTLALILAGFLTVGLPCLILIALVIGTCLLLFGGR